MTFNQLSGGLPFCKTLASKQYEDLQFGKPEVGKYVIIEFTVSDTNDARHERDSQNILKNVIMETLKDTNWRLMSDGVSYRLGILTGRLKAYENIDELLKIITIDKHE
jgi:hypothetical protein